MPIRDSSPDHVLTGRFEPGEERRYRLVPFDVPAGVRQLHLEVDYNQRIDSDPRHRGGNTLDIGLFDERGLEAGGPGFRGWSGSERVSITIDEEWATPPYRSGPIGGGTWHVLLGPYKIAKVGLAYRVGVWFDPGLLQVVPEIARRGPPVKPTLPPAAEPAWYRGDLHCHSLYSDGDSWPSELMIAGAEAGLDFLAITDHNGAVRPTAPDDPDGNLPLLIPGIEITTYKGHWNVWGIDGWFDFRDPSTEGIQAEMRRAASAGGFVSINHPKPWGPEWVYEGDESDARAIEVWNGPWERLNVFALAEWERRLMEGRRLVAVGGSDTHNLRNKVTNGPDRTPQLGEPTTWVKVDGPLTIDSLLAGLRAGHCFVSASPSGPQVYIRRGGEGVSIRAVGGEGSTLQAISRGETVTSAAVTSSDWTTVIDFPAEAPYLRAQVVDALGQTLAISNPIWATSQLESRAILVAAQA